MKIFISIVLAFLVIAFLRFQVVSEMAENAMVSTVHQARKLQAKTEDTDSVKIFVSAKDAKKCMQLLNTNVINNEVVECNKDHYVMVKRDKVEAFKRAQEIK